MERALLAPKIAVIGHSRGGKAAVAAALWDPRIQALVSHNSGTGGVSRHHPNHPGAEGLADLAQRYPHWLSPLVQGLQHQALCVQNNWPADGLHALAPRGLCILQAEDDLWANPAGSRAMFEQLQPAWQAAPERLRWHSRTGGHAMTALDWQRAAEFLTQVL
jgi:pimeloyl-ACP methyl ester carboxylesterase